MADNGRWFKLWTTAPYDPHLANFSLEDFARWCLFGCYLKTHGQDGILKITPPAISLQQLFRVTNYDIIIDIIRKFPSCKIDDHVTDAIVTWQNWLKYQGDWSNDRVAKFRESVTPKKRREEKRKEEIRKEENIIKNSQSSPTLSDADFIAVLKNNPAYKNIDIETELHKMDVWLLTPKARGRKRTRKFIVNWLNRVDVGNIPSGRPMTHNDRVIESFINRMRDEDNDERRGNETGDKAIITIS